MLKKIVFAVLVLIAVIILWQVFKAFQQQPEETNERLFETDFMSAISQQVTSGLALTDETSPAQVDIDELGEFSPVAGMVEIVSESETVSTEDVADEYIAIRAKETNAEPINISDWSLQSMISDIWIGLPQGTEIYVSGDVNEVNDIYLRPGETAIIATRRSPVGVSFRVNQCSGFLSETQEFNPRLRTQCINPRDLLPPTIDNIRDYGASCVEFVENMPSCTYVTSSIEGFGNLPQECLSFIQPRLTNNFCNGVFAPEETFYDAREWRIFLNQTDTLWRENYEVIRLLDEKHRTVDVLNY